MQDENQPIEENRSFYWMTAVNLIYKLVVPGEGTVERSRSVNVLTKTFNPHINHAGLQNIQKQAQMQAIGHHKIPRKAEIIDVIMVGHAMLGHMTDAEFQEGAITHANTNEDTDGSAQPNSQ